MTNTQLYHTLVKEFMVAFDQKTYSSTSNVPMKTLEFRGKLIAEEADEYSDGLKTNNKLEQLDGLCDLAYVVTGTMHTCNLSPIPFSTGDDNLNTPCESIECAVDLLIGECNFARPCHERMYLYCNECLTAIDTVAYRDFDLPSAFKAVHANNMDKLWSTRPEDKTLLVIPREGGRFLVKNRDGKVIKPANHQPPDLKPFIY